MFPFGIMALVANQAGATAAEQDATSRDNRAVVQTAVNAQRLYLPLALRR